MKRLLIGSLMAASACSLGEGQGRVYSDDLRAGTCFQGPYDLNPTFFASNPHKNTQQLRVQRHDDFIENSDGVEILVRDTRRVRANLGKPLRVGLSPEVTPPGVPVVADPEPPIVNLVLYLHETCHGQNIALYAIDGTIVFKHLFSGDLTEIDGGEKLIEFEFDVTVADPRDAPAGSVVPPPEKTTRLIGTGIRYYFQRGPSAQPFP